MTHLVMLMLVCKVQGCRDPLWGPLDAEISQQQGSTMAEYGSVLGCRSATKLTSVLDTAVGNVMWSWMAHPERNAQ
jgi:hypothetical protein